MAEPTPPTKWLCIAETDDGSDPCDPNDPHLWADDNATETFGCGWYEAGEWRGRGIAPTIIRPVPPAEPIPDTTDEWQLARECVPPFVIVGVDGDPFDDPWVVDRIVIDHDGGGPWIRLSDRESFREMPFVAHGERVVMPDTGDERRDKPSTLYGGSDRRKPPRARLNGPRLNQRKGTGRCRFCEGLGEVGFTYPHRCRAYGTTWAP